MKHLLLLVSLLLATVCSYADDPFETPEKIYGRVKQIETKTYHIKVKFGVHDRTLVHHMVADYNPAGVITGKSIIYWPNRYGSIAKRDVRKRLTVTYNEHGDPLVEYDNRGVTSRYEYDARGNVVMIKGLRRHKELFSYSEDSTRVVKDEYFGTLFSRTFYDYDTLRRLLREVVYDDEGALKESTVYKYSPGVMSYRCDLRGGRGYELATYEYGKGGEVLRSAFDGSYSSADRYVFVYVYDRYGNWIERNEYLVGGSVSDENVLLTTKERTISYYD